MKEQNASQTPLFNLTITANDIYRQLKTEILIPELDKHFEQLLDLSHSLDSNLFKNQKDNFKINDAGEIRTSLDELPKDINKKLNDIKSTINDSISKFPTKELDTLIDALNNVEVINNKIINQQRSSSNQKVDQVKVNFDKVLKEFKKETAQLEAPGIKEILNSDPEVDKAVHKVKQSLKDVEKVSKNNNSPNILGKELNNFIKNIHDLAGLASKYMGQNAKILKETVKTIVEVAKDLVKSFGKLLETFSKNSTNTKDDLQSKIESERNTYKINDTIKNRLHDDLRENKPGLNYLLSENLEKQSFNLEQINGLKLQQNELFKSFPKTIQNNIIYDEKKGNDLEERIVKDKFPDLQKSYQRYLNNSINIKEFEGNNRNLQSDLSQNIMKSVQPHEKEVLNIVNKIIFIDGEINKSVKTIANTQSALDNKEYGIKFAVKAAIQDMESALNKASESLKNKNLEHANLSKEKMSPSFKEQINEAKKGLKEVSNKKPGEIVTPSVRKNSSQDKGTGR